MPFQVIDTIDQLDQNDINLLVSYGVVSVSRYIARTSAIGKIIRKPEVDLILRDGRLGLLINYEQSGTEWQQGYQRGHDDGAWARQYTRGLGLPDSVVITQSVDTGVAGSAMATCAEYQRGFNDGGGCGPQGMYGPGVAISYVAARGLLRIGWQWMDVKGSASVPAANIRQYRDKPYSLPFSYDVNTPITPYYGQHPAPGIIEGDGDLTDAQDKILNAILQKVLALPANVWDEVMAGRFGFPDDIAEHYLVDARAAAGYSQQGVVDLSVKVDALAAKVDNLAVGGVDLVALAELVRAQVRAELDKTKLAT